MSKQPSFSVCEFTTPDTTFEQDLELAKLVDADIGVCEARLREGEEEQQALAMKAAGLSATVCIPNNISPLPCEPAYPGPKDYDERMELMFSSFRRLAHFDPDVVVVVTGDDPEMDRKKAHDVALEGLREAARYAGELGLTLGFEPIRRDGGLLISLPTTLRESVEWVEEIGEPNVGITYDVFNLFRSENLLEDTERYAKMINSVHVNDWVDPPRGFSDRTVPGDGILPLPEIFAALERGGFEGTYDLEIFAADGLEHDGGDALWRQPPEEIVRRGREGFDRAFAAAANLV
jgi:sugar phosphate isomerase/epimerase